MKNTTTLFLSLFFVWLTVVTYYGTVYVQEYFQIEREWIKMESTRILKSNQK